MVTDPKFAIGDWVTLAGIVKMEGRLYTPPRVVIVMAAVVVNNRWEYLVRFPHNTKGFGTTESELYS